MTTVEQPRLKVTKSYELFELHPLNRELHSLENLIASMKDHGFDEGFPIRCVRNGNGKLKITSGHNRFHVAKMLDLPVWYIEARRDIPLFDAEKANIPWKLKDWLFARGQSGDEGALAVIRYMEETGITCNAAISLIGGEGAGSHNKAEEIQKGTFDVGNTDHAYLVGAIVKRLREMGVAFATNNMLVKAISKACLVDCFDVELFIRKCETHQAIMEPRRSVDDYLDLIETIYNRQSQNKVNVAFLARETSRRRSVAHKS